MGFGVVVAGAHGHSIRQGFASDGNRPGHHPVCRVMPAQAQAGYVRERQPALPLDMPVQDKIKPGKVPRWPSTEQKSGGSSFTVRSRWQLLDSRSSRALHWSVGGPSGGPWVVFEDVSSHQSMSDE